MPKLPKNTLALKIILSAILIFSFYRLAFTTVNPFRIISLKYGDILTRLNYRLSKPPAEIKDIAIIKIDDESIKRINKKLPWPRYVIADLLAKINLYPPKVLVLDIVMLGQSSNPQEDLYLAQELLENKNTLLGAYFDEKGLYTLPIEIFREKTSNWGFINHPRDTDLYLRRTKLLKVAGGKKPLDYALPLKAAALYLDCPLSEIEFRDREIILPSKNKGLIKIPLEEGGITPLNFTATLDRFRNISVWEALKPDYPLDFLKDKIVFIGATSELLHDIHPTPLGLMPGVALLADDVAMIIARKFMRPLPYGLAALILFLACGASAYLSYRLSIFRGMISSLLLMAIFFIISLVFTFKNYTGDFFGPVFVSGFTFLGVSVYKYVELIVESARLKTLAITDGLTGLYGYRYFALVLSSEFEKARIGRRDLSLVIMDIDHFKMLNDTYGHEEGNLILKSLAELLRQSVRKTDILCRYGGEEFVAILRDTNQNGGEGFAEKIRRVVADYNFPGAKNPLKVTLSFGVCGLQESKVGAAEELIKCADTGLYQAKKEGRNRVCVYAEEK